MFSTEPFSIANLSLILLLLLYFFCILVPISDNDGLSTHYFISSIISSYQKWNYDISSYIWAVNPMTPDLLYSYIYIVSGNNEVAINLFRLSNLILIISITKNFFQNNQIQSKTFYLAIFLFLLSPLTFWILTHGFIDITWLMFLFVSLVSIANFYKTRDEKYFLISILLFSFALQAKNITLIYTLVYVPFFLTSNKKEIKKIIPKSIIIFMIFGILSHLYAYIKTGNPVFFLYNGIFKSPLYFPVNFSTYPLFNDGIEFDFFYNILFSNKYNQIPYSAFHLAMIIPCIFSIIISNNKVFKHITLFLITLFIISFLFTSYTRYVFPLFLILAIVIAYGFFEIINTKNRIVQTLAISLLSFCLTLNFLGSYYIISQKYIPGSIIRIDFKNYLKINWSDKHKDEYFKNYDPIRYLVSLSNKYNINKKPVAFFSHPHGAGLRSNALYANWYNFQFFSKIDAAKNENELLKLLNEYNCEYFILDDNYRTSQEAANPDKYINKDLQIDKLKKIGKLIFKINNLYLYNVKEK